MAEVWLPFALAATVLWGVGQIAAKRGATALGPRPMVVVVGLSEAGIFLAAYVAFGGDAFADVAGAVLGFAAGVTGMLGYVLYYEAIARGTISRIGTVIAAYPAATVLLALLVLREAVGGIQAAGVVLLLASAVLLGRAEERATRGKGHVVPLLIVLAFLFWGVWGFLVKVAVDRVGEGTMFAYFALANVAVAVGLLGTLDRRRGRSFAAARGAWRWPLATIVAGSAGVILMTLAFAAGPATLVAPVTGAYPVVTVLVAAPLLRERLGRPEVVAFAAFLLGLVAVASA
jgi:drug/metabolite transporter (DMT)-like permease